MASAYVGSDGPPDTGAERPDPIEEARIALQVWSSEPPYGTSRHDVTMARTAAVHLSTLFKALDTERSARADAERRLRDVDYTISLCGIGDYKTWKEAQDQAYEAVRTLKARVDVLELLVEDYAGTLTRDQLETLIANRNGTA